MALDRQSYKNFEVILSEDDYNEDTKVFLKTRKDLYNYPITHIYQEEDKGFRKNKMLNKSIIHSKTDKLVFIDADCIPHKHFVKSYVNSLQENYIFEGRTVVHDRMTSEKVKKEHSLEKLYFFI